jgi:octaprenyl-diphosphate synthase
MLADRNDGSGALPEQQDLGSVLQAVERYRGVEDTVRRAREHVARARECIAAFPEGPPKRALLAAADYAVERDR